ncbi:MAG: histidine phosphatase family protein [Motiliproteus sp.]|nr:histidine phosphatase family protein [Motiliproteus sp.]MCW9053967.1 histidine phosphatase family protein [Motiliproteus sp.]
MKDLFLIRHAKSSWDNPELLDHDRPLNRRGRKSIVAMSKRIENHGWQVQQLLTSTATRAITTAQGLVESICKGGTVKAESTLYTFDDEVLMTFIRNYSGEEDAIALVGHNPAMEYLLEQLVFDNTPDKFPTCAVAHLELQIDHWRQLKPGCGSLKAFEYPKKAQ